MNPPDEVIISIRISPEEYLKAYRGPGRTVLARDSQGRRVRFPADILRPFVAHDGVQGVFRIEYHPGGRFKRISRV